MSHCPNCRAEVLASAESCVACGAIFTGDGWKPIAGVAPIKPEGTSAAGVIALLGFATVLIPAACFVIGLVLSLLIPGCHCDEGAGCSGCGVDRVVGFLLFGGFAGGLGALMFVLPASLLLAGIVGLLTKTK
jgi:hypothetical protein